MTIMLEKGLAVEDGSGGMSPGGPAGPGTATGPAPTAPGAAEVAGAAGAEVAGAGEPVGEKGQVGQKTGHRALMYPLAVVMVVSGLAAAGTGFALSYGVLRDAAEGWGYTGWKADAFPLGMDGLIIALYTADLWLSWKRMSRPWVRMCAHVLTAVTIGLNVTAASGTMPGSPGLWQAFQADPGRLGSHAMMPFAYVILTEVARWAIVRTARIEGGYLDDQALTLADWVMNYRVTKTIYRHAKVHAASYAEAREFVRELAVYRVWQKERVRYTRGTAQDRAALLDRMPALLAPYGVTVDQARAIPARMHAQEQAQEQAQRQAERQEREDRERQKHQEEQAEQTRKRDKELRERRERQERERQEREDAHQARMDVLAKEADQARQEAELATLKATADGETRAAAHRAEATAATAGIQAQAALSAAEAEHQAAETARTAALRRKTAEDAQAEAAAAAETQRLAAQTARSEREAAEDARKTAVALKDEAAARAEAARLDHEAALEESRTVRLRDEAARLAHEGLSAAELDRKTAQERQAEAAAAAETQRLAAEAARSEREAAEDTRKAGLALNEDARARAEAARLAHETAQRRAQAARIERQAAEDEDTARLQPRERAVRKVARMVLAAGGDAVALYEIEQACGVKQSTASDYLTEARTLIANGYGQEHQEHAHA